jgi:hypothetical protein
MKCSATSGNCGLPPQLPQPLLLTHPHLLQRVRVSCV